MVPALRLHCRRRSAAKRSANPSAKSQRIYVRIATECPDKLLIPFAADRKTTLPFAALAIFLCAPAMWGQVRAARAKSRSARYRLFRHTGSTASVRSSAVYSTGTRRYTFGMSAELQLRHSLGVEIDALYHRMGYQGAINTQDAVGNYTKSNINVAGNTLDFPVMAKYHFGHVIHPYVVGGGVIRWITSARETGAVVSGSRCGRGQRPVIRSGPTISRTSTREFIPGSP